MTTTDKAKNTAQQAKGKLKETVGKASGNNKLRAEGKADQVKGNVKRAARSSRTPSRSDPTPDRDQRGVVVGPSGLLVNEKKAGNDFFCLLLFALLFFGLGSALHLLWIVQRSSSSCGLSGSHWTRDSRRHHFCQVVS